MERNPLLGQKMERHHGFLQAKGSDKGAFFSSYLFIIHKQNPKTGLDSEEEEVTICGRNSNTLRRADGTVLRAERSNDWEGLLMKVQEGSAKEGLHWSIRQTKCLTTKKKKKYTTSTDNEGIEIINDFPYLGSATNSNGDCRQEMKRRLTQKDSSERIRKDHRRAKACQRR